MHAHRGRGATIELGVTKINIAVLHQHAIVVFIQHHLKTDRAIRLEVLNLVVLNNHSAVGSAASDGHIDLSAVFGIEIVPKRRDKRCVIKHGISGNGQIKEVPAEIICLKINLAIRANAKLIVGLIVKAHIKRYLKRGPVIVT